MTERFLVYIEEVGGEVRMTEEELQGYRELCEKVKKRHVISVPIPKREKVSCG